MAFLQMAFLQMAFRSGTSYRNPRANALARGVKHPFSSIRVAAIEAAVSGRPFAASSHPTEAKAAQQSNLAGLASGRAYSDRSVGASTKLTEVPNVALRVHAGWLKKAGDSAFAKSHQRCPRMRIEPRSYCSAAAARRVRRRARVCS